MALKMQKRLPTDLSDFSQLDFIKNDSPFLEDIYLPVRLDVNRGEFIPELFVAFLSVLQGIVHCRFLPPQ
jgi:hypothetical protein